MRFLNSRCQEYGIQDFSLLAVFGLPHPLMVSFWFLSNFREQHESSVDCTVVGSEDAVATLSDDVNSIFLEERAPTNTPCVTTQHAAAFQLPSSVQFMASYRHACAKRWHHKHSRFSSRVRWLGVARTLPEFLHAGMCLLVSVSSPIADCAYCVPEPIHTCHPTGFLRNNPWSNHYKPHTSQKSLHTTRIWCRKSQPELRNPYLSLQGMHTRSVMDDSNFVPNFLSQEWVPSPKG